MEIVRESPFARFLTEASKKKVDHILAAFPFITMPMVDEVNRWMRKRASSLTLVTNLSAFTVAVSLQDPAAPLIELVDALGDRMHVWSCGELHGKLLLADDRVGLFGSSNLTSGGEIRNRELNALVDSKTKAGREHIGTLMRWHQELLVDSTLLDADALRSISAQWVEMEKVRFSISAATPETRLGGNYVKAAMYFAEEPKRRYSTAAKRISSKTDDDGVKRPAKNVENKLLFLRDIGIVSRWDSQWIYRAESAADLARDVDAFYERLTAVVPGLAKVLGVIARRKNATYAQLDEEFAQSVDSDDIRIAANWLHSLGFVHRTKKGAFQYSATSTGLRHVDRKAT